MVLDRFSVVIACRTPCVAPSPRAVAFSHVMAGATGLGTVGLPEFWLLASYLVT